MQGNIRLSKEEFSQAISEYLGNNVTVTSSYFWDHEVYVDIGFVSFVPPAVEPPKASPATKHPIDFVDPPAVEPPIDFVDDIPF